MWASNNAEVFEWVYQHVGVVGYPALCLFVWKASKYFSRISDAAIKAVDQVDMLTTNHFPHMAESLKTQDGLLHSMDQSLKIIAERTPEQAKAASASRRKK